MIYAIVAIAVIVALIRYFVNRPYRFFEARGIKYATIGNPYIETLKIMCGRADMVGDFKKYYEAEPNNRLTGAFIFKMPTLLLRDPDIIREVAIKEFDHFTDHVDVFFKEDIDQFFGKSLFALKGKRWHDMRTTLSPAFTGSKMRGMFDLMAACGEQLVSHLNKQFDMQTVKKPMEIEFKETTTRFTNDMIATTAFGIKVDSFADRDNEFYSIGRGLAKIATWRLLLLSAFPKIAKIAKIGLMPPKVYTFFSRLMKDTIDTRKKQNIIRPDMVHLLLEARKELENKNNIQSEGVNTDKKSHLVLTDLDITAQSFLFFFAGFETVSVAMCFSIYELTINPDIQKRLQDEIDETLASCNGKVTYDAIMKMKYIEMVVSETLRKWPPVAGIDRQCTKKLTLRKNNEETVTVEPGMAVHLAIMGIHRDEKYYKNPEKYDPERFNDENKELIQPGSYIPFGYGPRVCIASRFALLETKVLLFNLFANFDFQVIEKTPIPMVLRKGASNLDAQDGFWVGLTPRKAR